MDARPAWFHRLEEIFTALRAMTSTHPDRLAVIPKLMDSWAISVSPKAPRSRVERYTSTHSQWESHRLDARWPPALMSCSRSLEVETADS